MKSRRWSVMGLVRSTGVFFCAILCATVLSAQAGTIFDDDWVPPKKDAGITPAPTAAPPTTAAPQPRPVRPGDRKPAVAPPPVVSPVAPAASPTAAGARHPIPDRAALATSRELLKEAYSAQLNDHSTAGRRKLAEQLLGDAPKMSDSASDLYAVLGGAIKAAGEGSSLPLMFRGIDQLCDTFDGINATAAKADAALHVSLKSDSADAIADNVQAAMDLVDKLVAVEDYDSASKLCGLVRPLPLADRQRQSAVLERCRQVENLRAAHERIVPMLETLRVSPNDPAANLVVGSYACFTRGEWGRGLPMLAKGTDVELRAQAALELSKPTSVAALTEEGDGWWKLAAKQPEANRPKILEHAAGIYRTILQQDGVTGLRRTIMEKRIAEAPAPIPPPDAAAPAADATDPAKKYEDIDTGSPGSGPKGAVFGSGGDAHQIVFLCNGAGSMINKMASLKFELGKSVVALHADQAFDILFFRDMPAQFSKREIGSEQLVPCTESVKHKAGDFIESISSEGVGDPMAALESALKLHPQLLYLLSDDAEFPDKNALLDTINRLNKDHLIHINTILFVDDKAEHEKNRDSETLMKQIASENGGKFRWVEINALGQ